MLANNLVDQDVSDFQQLESWRRLTPVVADELVRVTVLHVLVEADEEVRRQRITTDQDEPTAVQWRLDHLDAYAEARSWLTASADLVLDTSHLTPEEAADQVWTLAAEHLVRRHSVDLH